MTHSDSLVKLSHVAVNVAILGVLGYMAASPGGYVRRTLAEHRAARELRKSISEVWGDVTAGAKSDAPVLVEFVDYQCHFCKTMQDTLRTAERQLGITVIHLQYPIRPIHPRAEAAARVAICAEAQGRFDAMHRYLFSTDEWYDSAIGWGRAMATAGIGDSTRFLDCLDSDATTARLARDSSIAARWGVRGTPTYVSLGGIHRGTTSLEQLVALTRE